MSVQSICTVDSQERYKKPLLGTLTYARQAAGILVKLNIKKGGGL